LERRVYITCNFASQGIDHSKQLDAQMSYSLLYTQRARMSSSCTTQTLHMCHEKNQKLTVMHATIPLHACVCFVHVAHGVLRTLG
jgi:hypothetical protein